MVVSMSPGSSWTVLFLYTAVFSLWLSLCHGLDISYCSSENNAGSYPSFYSEFQSNGLCQGHCQGSYAFAVLQGYYCWCSNYIPTQQESTYNCNQVCPGYGSEWCGSTSDGLYGYYLLSAGVPLGTSGSGSSTPSATYSTPSQSSSSSVSIITSTSASSSPLDTGLATSSRSTSTWPVYHSSSVVTPGPSQSSAEASIVTWSTDTSSTSTSFLPTSTPPSSTYNPPPTPAPTEVYTSVTTVTGEVRTVVVTPSPAASSDATLGQSSTDGGGGVSTGKVVGIVLGVALGIGILIGIAVYLWFRRRHNKLQEQRGPETAFVPRAGDGSPPNIVPSRQVSQMSTAGLLGSKAPRINTSMGILGSDLRSADPTISSNSASDRRSLGTDQRLNPYALYMSEQGRVSNVSLQDNQDYSRQLRVSAAQQAVGG
ncbi:hypothetical protein G647_05011 [Cladophialophora carrionii CBS 160.54]|uniref:WSC domain-containing protein n=1 Tax=Cladophialophora carrionii CBS 160.54 TaxID=1279043 RepID=V9DA83_9EURO|nr:uncharacterized protein G647_05011 [Cladophialophora carrionii CBS 160.54]ETI23213.1 hypothetical protein G647_05011 [Cladophialophora carrionii CBS 160.54]